MQQIWTNPSLQRSFKQIDTGMVNEIISVLKVQTSNEENNKTSIMYIVPGMEYSVTFYDSSLGCLYSIAGLVEDVYEDQIKIKYIKNKEQKHNSDHGNNKQKYPMPTCNCILNPPDISKYEGPSVVFIPIMNIVNISYEKMNNDKKPKDGGVRVMLLGISATTVKAIIIRLAFFEDNLEEAIKYVDLEVDNVYDLTYESRDGAIYESRVKVMKIEEIDPDEEPCKPGKGYVREHIGCHNSVYVNKCCSKDDFMVAPPVKKVRIIVDTSETFTGRYEAIMLDSIRDCVLVYDANNDNAIDNNTNKNYCDCCNHKSHNCNPNSCGHYAPSQNNSCNSTNTFVYKYDNCKAVVNGDKVTINISGQTSNIDLETVLKYYLGIG